jgi:hypothetical protein
VELAANFHEQLASSSAKRASVRTTALTALFLVGLAAEMLGPANRFSFGVVVFVGAQLASVAAVLGLVRWVRYRNGVPASRLADVWRANLVAVGCVAVVSLAELVDSLESNSALAIGSTVMLVLALPVSLEVIRSMRRACVVQAGAPTEDALDDFVALVPQLAPILRRTQALLRVRPWFFCAAFAAACGIALAAQHNAAEGGVAISWRPLLAALIIASIEAAAVVACFAAFGRLLGIRR